MGRLLGREHASTPQNGVEAPRLLKRSLPRLYFVVVVVVVVGGGGGADLCASRECLSIPVRACT